MRSATCLSIILACLSSALFGDGMSLAREELATYLGDKAAAIVTQVDPSMDAEAWSARGEGGRVELRGGSARGLCYAAYEFLEREVGVRWLTPWGEEYAPACRDIPRRTFSHAGRPKLDYRWFLDFGYNVSSSKGGHRFLFRQRHNIIDGDKVHPLAVRFHPPMTHNIFHYIPPAKYFKAHPDYFTLNAEGVRTDGMQLCFSNEGLQAELEKNFLEHVESCGGKGVFDLTVRDLPGRLCHCPACREAERRVGSIGGAYYEFVRRLGRVLEKRHPAALMHFSAYRLAQTEVPPKAAFGRFPPNCVVVFAPIDNDFSKDYAHANNRLHLENLRNWRRSVDHLWEWYYPLTYGGFTLYSGVRRCATDLTLAYRAGLTGGTFEHDVGTRIGAGFADLHTYLISRLYCDPEQDWRPIAEEFCRLYYGCAAETVLAFMDALDAVAEARTAPLRWDAGMEEVDRPGFLAEWSAKLDAAERTLGSDGARLQRLREFRLSLDLAVLRNWRKFEKEGVSEPGSADAVLERALTATRAAVDRRFSNPKVADQFFTAYANGAKEAHHRATVRAKPLPEPFASLPEKDVIEILAKATCNARTRPDPEAAIGLAVYDPRHFERPLEKYEIGFSDQANGRQYKRRVITREETVPDRYHFYHLGRYALSQDCLVYMSWTWRLQFKLDQYWMPGGEDLWDVYVSLKLEGPLFSDRSKAKENRVSFDRAVLVRVPKDEAAQPKNLPVGEALPALPPDPFPDRISAYVWHNWGLVDYNQLLKLTGMSIAQMKSVLLDHDFLFQKLGRMKPLCRPLVYRADEVALTHGARMSIVRSDAHVGYEYAVTKQKFICLNTY